MAESNKEDKANRLQRVVGIQYTPGEGLPRVILKGSGAQAEAIIDHGKRLPSLPLVEDETLLAQLYRLPMEAEIGPELYELVAMLLVHVYAIEERNNRIKR